MTTVHLRNYRQAPRKVRLLAGLVRGKGVDKARSLLAFSGKRAWLPIDKLLQSAVAAAKENGVSSNTKELYIEKMTVDKGFTYKRMRPRAFGRGAPIHKETSHISLTLEKTSPTKKETPRRETEVGAEKK